MCWSTTSHLHICHNNGEITLPAFVKDYEDVFSETEAGMLSQSMLIRTRDRRISLCNLPQKNSRSSRTHLRYFEKRIAAFAPQSDNCRTLRPLPLASETLDRSPPLRRKLHDHNRIRIRKPSALATDNISINTLWPSQYTSHLLSVY